MNWNKRESTLAAVLSVILTSVAISISNCGGPARAEPLPVPKPIGPGGSCPYGYVTSGSYCVPMQGASDAVPKPPNGTCPWGWTSSASSRTASR